STGTKSVYRLKLASGKEVRATANHPFLTYGGWTPLGELEVGSRIGVPRHVPAPELEAEWDDRRVIDAGAALSAGAEGSVRIPEQIFHLPKRQIARFLRTWWSAGATVGAHGIAARADNAALRDAIARLLLRFGISTMHTAGGGLCIVGSDDLRRFLQEIGIDGSQSASAEALLERVREEQRGQSTAAASLPVWSQVEHAITRRRAPAGAPTMNSVAALLADEELEIEAVNDVLWDTVTALEYE